MNFYLEPKTCQLCVLMDAEINFSLWPSEDKDTYTDSYEEIA